MSVFDAHQRETIEAAMARIIPTDHDPGAREAGTVDFLERYLSGVDCIYARSDGTFAALDSRTAAIWQRRIDDLRRQYAEGVQELDRHSRGRFDRDFCRLTDDEQDAVLRVLERPTAEDGPVDATLRPETTLQQPVVEHGLDFFRLLILHTRQGFYGDPVYGGNRDHAGWKTIGFAGPDSLSDAQTGAWSTAPYFAEEAR